MNQQHPSINQSISWFTIFFFCLLSNHGLAQPVDSAKEGTRHMIHSNQLGEDREYLLSLPRSYEQDEFYIQKRYPVLLLLDADTHFRYASSMIQFMSSGEIEQIPEMIVVAIVNTNRTRDMTAALPNKPDKFLAFLENELLPQIDKQYKTLPYRVIVGHSLAGLFALNCFLDQRTFQAYIAIDPTLTWNQNALIRKAESILATNTSFQTRLYVAQANNPFDPGQHVGNRGAAFDSFTAQLANNKSGRFAYQHSYYEHETHFSVPFQALRDGLLFIFDGYSFPITTFLSEGSFGISGHYQELFTRLGTDLLPPGKVINQAGLFLLNSQKQTDKAIDLLTLNQKYYATTAVTYASLGDSYKANRDTLKAVEQYKQALTIKPTDEVARQSLNELNKK